MFFRNVSSSTDYRAIYRIICSIYNYRCESLKSCMYLLVYSGLCQGMTSFCPSVTNDTRVDISPFCTAWHHLAARSATTLYSAGIYRKRAVLVCFVISASLVCTHSAESLTILNIRKHDVSGTGSVSVLKRGEEDTYSVGSLR
jgi:hypothetical protein